MRRSYAVEGEREGEKEGRGKEIGKERRGSKD
jgi:hypothetical protein